MIPGTQYLFVITTYDGDFNAYIQAFTNLLGDVFNRSTLLCRPCSTTSRATERCRLPSIREPVQPANRSLFGLPRLHRRADLGQWMHSTPITVEVDVNALQLDDIQGIILRGYGSFAHVRHFIVAVADAGRARAHIGEFARPVSVASNPDKLAVTTAATWHVKPDYTLNLAFTYEGLVVPRRAENTSRRLCARICQRSYRERQNALRCGRQRPGQLGRKDGDCVRGSRHLFSLRAHLS